MANLPEDRILPDKPPFTNTGVDFFGPFDVKRGRKTVKRYGVLFTCLTLRAVHIEVADSLDTDSCINAILRFVSRRGQVTIMRSDNGNNFVGAEREMREAIQLFEQNPKSLATKGNTVDIQQPGSFPPGWGLGKTDSDRLSSSSMAGLSQVSRTT